jgi:hypothetical protein
VCLVGETLNKMDSKNMATIFAPSLLKSRSNRPQDVLGDLEYIIQVSCDLIQNYRSIMSVDVCSSATLHCNSAVATRTAR